MLFFRRGVAWGRQADAVTDTAMPHTCLRRCRQRSGSAPCPGSVSAGGCGARGKPCFPGPHSGVCALLAFCSRNDLGGRLRDHRRRPPRVRPDGHAPFGRIQLTGRGRRSGRSFSGTPEPDGASPPGYGWAAGLHPVEGDPLPRLPWT
ncbi:hypothetical protein ROP_pROB02-01920 (plasmid) [Rhodococcus opacus B4]|uniref:Uncharacterized protein n=1 Tax=Rhodococcus opacus (strain B4) TaxID=632772 RepID=C1BDZ6_RHOOB|nr:hypothetical protein ROP_pROB02-01920 [Rhodococcus opacus B4]